MSVSEMGHLNVHGGLRASMTDKCVVLDLDQTLIATQNDIGSLHELEILSDPRLMELRGRIYCINIEDLEKPGIGTKYDFWGVTRPHTQQFLKFCFSYFKVVAVWSAGKRPYVEAIVDHIFKDIQTPDIIFTHDDVIFGPLRQVEKPLIKIISVDPRMSLQKTLAIDDNVMTFCHNVGNGVLIPAYEPKLSISSFNEDDPALLQLMQWLLLPEVAYSGDVSTLDMTHIFTTPVLGTKKEVIQIFEYNFQ